MEYDEQRAPQERDDADAARGGAADGAETTHDAARPVAADDGAEAIRTTARPRVAAGAGLPASDAGNAADGAKLSILDIAYGILFSPRPTLASLAAAPRLGQALVWYAVVGLVSTLGSAPELGRAVGGAGLLGLAVAGVAVSLVVSFVVAGMWHILAELFGGRGRGVGMWALMAYSSTPSIFAALGAVLSRLSSVVWVLVQVGLAVWVVVLEVLAVRANYRLSGGRAFAVVVIPVAAFLVLGLVAMAAMVAALPGVLGLTP